MDKISDKIGLLPDSPGVYIMKNDRGQIIYVGKAASLRKRVRNHFAGSAGSVAGNTSELEYIATGSEVEALILECTLIKRHKPRYNVRLRDDKRYPYIRLSADEFPGVYLTRKTGLGGSYYGPYTDADAARRTVRLLRDLFKLRVCRGGVAANRRPCLYYHLGKCRAPCSGKVSREEYGGSVAMARLFLGGRTGALAARLEKKMNEESRLLNFEEAAALRDQAESVKQVHGTRIMESGSDFEEDYIACVSEAEAVCAGVMAVREGRVSGFEYFFMEGAEHRSESEVLSSFAKQYYSGSSYAPPDIFFSAEPADSRAIVEWLAGKRGRKVGISVPARGRRLGIILRLKENLSMKIAESGEMEKRRRRRAALEEIKDIAGLAEIPSRMECFDIAHTGGSQATGAVAVFEDGLPRVNMYRKFRIKSAPARDDAGMISEVVGRRYSRVLAEGKELPHLVLVDGGKAQVNAALRAVRLAGAEVPVAGLAKKFEVLYLPGGREPVEAGRDSYGLNLLMHMRDEAHRTASGFHRKLRSSALKDSVLDRVPGLGSRKKSALMAKFRDAGGVRDAAEAQLRLVPGIGEKTAAKIKRALGGEEEEKHES